MWSTGCFRKLDIVDVFLYHKEKNKSQNLYWTLWNQISILFAMNYTFWKFQAMAMSYELFMSYGY